MQLKYIKTYVFVYLIYIIKNTKEMFIDKEIENWNSKVKDKGNI